MHLRWDSIWRCLVCVFLYTWPSKKAILNGLQVYLKRKMIIRKLPGGVLYLAIMLLGQIGRYVYQNPISLFLESKWPTV